MITTKKMIDERLAQKAWNSGVQFYYEDQPTGHQGKYVAWFYDPSVPGIAGQVSFAGDDAAAVLAQCLAAKQQAAGRQA